MLVIGLTGGIGSGKTVVAQLFANRGIPVIDADLIARQLTEPHQAAFIAIVKHFADINLLKEDGTLNRATLRSIIFKENNERVWLEQLLHPLIRKEMHRQVMQIAAPVPYCIVVIPLLFESDPHSFIDRILVVDTPEETQINRVSARDKIPKADILTILQAQTTREQRLSQAHDIIINDGQIADLEPQIEGLHQLYSELARK